MTNDSSKTSGPGDATAATVAERLAESTKRLQSEASELLENLRPRIDAVASYAKEQPIKTLLIAAACGAVAMGLLTLAARPSGRRSTGFGNIRRIAQNAADQATQMASDAIDRASAAADSATKSARQSAGSAFDGLADTVKGWRDQAAPLVERFQPQIDSLTSYAKNEPAKSALLVATAGAALAGLLALITSGEDD